MQNSFLSDYVNKIPFNYFVSSCFCMKQAVTFFKSMCNQPPHFKVCLSFAIITLSKYSLCLTHVGLMGFLSMPVVIGSVSYVA